MGRKSRIGRQHKNYEKKRQATNKNTIGRPSKHRKCEEQSTNSTSTVTHTIDEFVKMKSVKLPSPLWSISHSDDHYVLYKVQEQSSSTQPIVISHYLTIRSDLSWSLSIYGQIVTSIHCSALAGSPDKVNCNELCDFLCKLDALTICPGHPDEHFVRMAATKGGNFFSPSGEKSAYLDSGMFKLNGEVYSETVRSVKCHRLVHGAKCSECVGYRDRLRANYHRWVNSQTKSPSAISTHSHTNERWLTAAQMEKKSLQMKSRLKASDKKITYLLAKIQESHDKFAINVDDDLHNGLAQIMNDHTMEINKKYQENTFHHLFWNQQVTNILKYPTQRRWHPMIIRWCLHLRMLSGSAYNALSRVLVLPTDRTLRDYTHYIKAGVGVQVDVTNQLMSEANIDGLEDWQKYVALVFDEVKIKEGIVYNKHDCSIVGFVDLGPVNNTLLNFESSLSQSESTTMPVAKQMLTFMVRGLFIKLHFPYAQYPTSGITAELLFPLVWEVIRSLECAGFKVISVTGDGASQNRKFFRMHKLACSSGSTFTHKVRNPYSKEERYLFFFVDVPHLLKTVRNCWSNSFGHSYSRALWVSRVANTHSVYVYKCVQIRDQHISWEHLRRLYKRRCDSGLTLLPKLTLEHINLNSYSRMRVYLAAQVLLLLFCIALIIICKYNLNYSNRTYTYSKMHAYYIDSFCYSRF